MYVLPVGEPARAEAHRIAAELRQAGLSTDIDLMGRSLSKSMKHANTINARRTVIVGEKEMSQGAVALRDMITGEQTMVKRDELVATLKK